MSAKADRTDIDEIEGSFEIDFNYKFPIGEKENFEFGYDGIFNNSQEDMDFELSGEDDLKTEEVDETWKFSGINDFDYSRSIHGFFAEYQLELNEKFSIKPSFRLEYVARDITFEKTLDLDNFGDSQSIYAELLERPFERLNMSEFNFFPDFTMTYNITDKKSKWIFLFGQKYDKSFYKKLLAAHFKKIMVCTNPDLIVERGKVREFCAGSVAKVFEELGGKVEYFGKPYPQVYNQATNVINRKVLCIGDNLNTDIRGANFQNFSSLLISNGIHREEINQDKITNLFKRYDVTVDFLQSNLKW